MYEAITSQQWKTLLSGVQAELGKGRISCFLMWRRLRCETPGRRKALLALGTLPVDLDNWYFPYVKVATEVQLRGQLRLGENSPGLLGGQGGEWQSIPDLETHFQSKFNPIGTNKNMALAALSEDVRRIIDEIAEVPPLGVTVIAFKRTIVVYKLRPIGTVADLVRFLRKSMDMADGMANGVSGNAGGRH